MNGAERIVTQVSRWDRLKDPLGVMRDFARHACSCRDAHLVLAGPAVAAVADDPEGAGVLAEGFGLTVAEAMWKGRPVLASAVGRIQNQITDGVTGVLLDDPTDLAGFGDALCRLLADPVTARRIGVAARARVRERFLEPRHLRQWVAVLRDVLA